MSCIQWRPIGQVCWVRTPYKCISVCVDGVLWLEQPSGLERERGDRQQLPAAVSLLLPEHLGLHRELFRQQLLWGSDARLARIRHGKHCFSISKGCLSFLFTVTWLCSSCIHSSVFWLLTFRVVLPAWRAGCSPTSGSFWVSALEWLWLRYIVMVFL